MAIIPGTNDADDLTGTSEDDVISGLGGSDALLGGAGADTLEGGDGADFLMGQEGADLILGGADNDTVRGDGGDAGDTIDGGDGVDMFDYSGSGNLAVDLTRGFSSSGASLVNIENVWGNAGNDSIRGGDEVNEFYGYEGDDTLERGGADPLDGEEGTDTGSYGEALAGVVASLAAPATNTGDAAGDTYASIEGLRESAFADRSPARGRAPSWRGNGGALVRDGWRSISVPGGRWEAEGDWVIQSRPTDRSAPFSGIILCRRRSRRARAAVSDFIRGVAAATPPSLTAGGPWKSSSNVVPAWTCTRPASSAAS